MKNSQLFELHVIKLIQYIKNLAQSDEKIRIYLKRHDDIIEYKIYKNRNKILTDSIKLIDDNSLRVIYDCLKQAFFDSYKEIHKNINDDFIRLEINNRILISFDSRYYSDIKWFNEQANKTLQKVKRK